MQTISEISINILMNPAPRLVFLYERKGDAGPVDDTRISPPRPFHFALLLPNLTLLSLCLPEVVISLSFCFYCSV